MAAVFAGAAHVPIATMMMVTEMTGGYTLLVPSALAVLLSYLVQSRLSAHAKYRSIYEAQVTSRAESPAHHAQHLAIALRILREHENELTNVAPVGELDLVALLRAGIPVELADDRRLFVGVVRADSQFAGTRISESGRKLGGPDTNIIALLRGEHMVSPRADTSIEAGDRLIVVSNASALARLRQELDPW
jgi:CIC family chloride channel protein